MSVCVFVYLDRQIVQRECAKCVRPNSGTDGTLLLVPLFSGTIEGTVLSTNQSVNQATTTKVVVVVLLKTATDSYQLLLLLAYLNLSLHLPKL